MSVPKKLGAARLKPGIRGGRLGRRTKLLRSSNSWQKGRPSSCSKRFWSWPRLVTSPV